MAPLNDDSTLADAREQGRSEVDEGLVLEEKLPVKLEALESAPDAYRLAGINDANDALLRAHFVLQDSIDIDEHDEVQQELRRLDLKLNLLIALVGDLLAGQGRLPASVPVRLTPETIRCQAGASAPDERVLVSLYLNPVIPRPLQLPGLVEAVAEGTATIVFEGLSQGVRDSLEKFIFRQHRRAVAQSRSRQ